MIDAIRDDPSQLTQDTTQTEVTPHRRASLNPENHVDSSTPIADLTFGDFLRRGSNGEDQKREPITYRTMPKGLKVAMRRLGRPDKKTLAEVSRHATQHGLEILRKETLLHDLVKVYRRAEERALEFDDDRALGLVESKVGYSFLSQESGPSSISAYTWVIAEIVEIADVTGLAKYQLAFGCCIVSLLTEPDSLQKYASRLEKERENLFKALERRHRDLTDLLLQ